MNPTHLLQQGFTLLVLKTSFWPESTLFVANLQRKKLSCFFLSNNPHVIALFATWWRYNVAYFWIFWEQLYNWWTFGLLIKMSPFLGFPHCFRSYCFYMLKEKWQPERWWKSIYIVKRVQRLFSFERVYNLDSISEIKEVVESDFKESKKSKPERFPISSCRRISPCSEKIAKLLELLIICNSYQYLFFLMSLNMRRMWSYDWRCILI